MITFLEIFLIDIIFAKECIVKRVYFIVVIYLTLIKKDTFLYICVFNFKIIKNFDTLNSILFSYRL